MKIVFVSNYYNHHQHALSQAFDRITEGQYHFVATSEMRADRKKLGYGQWEQPNYVVLSYVSEAEKERSMRLISDADVVIAGSAPWDMIKERIASGKLVFRYSERPLKQNNVSLRQVLHFCKTRIACGGKRKVYLLSAGAYAVSDYARFGCFRGRSYRWGYFPQVNRYPDVDKLLSAKETATILWAGRFLDWKHPEMALHVADRLKREGYSFRLNMIGTGFLCESLEQFIEENGLRDCVRMLGAMPPERVREHMERAGIYLFTSNRQEGWGAVLNEAMNSGCAVVASHAAGSVSYLVKDMENGMIFLSEDEDSLYRKVKCLLDDPAEQKRLGRAAYDTVSQMWNADVAAQRLVELSESILQGETSPINSPEGPCSVAPVINDDWYE